MPSESLTHDWLSHTWIERFDLWGWVGYQFPKDGKLLYHQEPVQRIDDAVARLHRWDARQLNTFYSCSMFKTSLNRTHENVAFSGLLYADIDLAPKSKYVTLADAADDVLRVCCDYSVPPPVFIASGGGMHIYWFLDRFIVLAAWEPIAKGLKRALIEAGLQIDPTRTGDASSILRPPGTCNWKTGTPREVLWDGKISITPVSTFEPFARHVERKPKLFVPGHVLKQTTLLSKASTYDAPSADEVADKCGQVAQLRVSGDLPEPLWHAIAGVMMRLKDGEEKFHEWSAHNFDNYDPDETQSKLDNNVAHTTGPTTCIHFHSINRSVCESCPFWQKIKIPIQAVGREQEKEDAPSEDINGHVVEVVAGDINLPNMDGTGMKWDNSKLVIAVDDNSKTKLHNRLVAPQPFMIKSVNNLESGKERDLYTHIRHRMPSGEWCEFSIPNTKLHSPAGPQMLAGQGLHFQDWGWGKKAITHMADQIKTTGTQYARMGWKEGGFLLGNRLYSATRVEQVPVTATLATRARMLRPALGGSLSEWRKDANKCFQRGLENMGLVLLSSLAAPLMALLSHEGGTLFHLVSPTGKGKTLALEIGASIWGAYDALRLISDDTRISKVILMGTICHAPIYLDELTAADPVIVANWIKTFTEGKDKARGTSEGEVRETWHHWATILLSASNQSVRDMLTGQGDTALAMDMRLIELRFNPTAVYTMLEMDALKNRMDQNSGWAGDAFLRYITADGAKEIIRERLHHVMDWLMKEYGFENQHRFYIRFLAGIFVAAEIGVKIGLFEVSPERMVRWTAEKVKAEIEESTREVTGKTIYHEVERSNAVKVLVDFLNEHHQYKLIVRNASGGLAQGVPILEPKGKAVYIRHEQSERLMYVHAKMFAKWLIEQKHTVSGILLELITLGILDQRKVGKDLGAGTVYEFGGKADCYAVRLAKFEPMTSEEGNVIKLERIKKKG